MNAWTCIELRRLWIYQQIASKNGKFRRGETTWHSKSIQDGYTTERLRFHRNKRNCRPNGRLRGIISSCSNDSSWRRGRNIAFWWCHLLEPIIILSRVFVLCRLIFLLKASQYPNRRRDTFSFMADLFSRMETKATSIKRVVHIFPTAIFPVKSAASKRGQTRPLFHPTHKDH